MAEPQLDTRFIDDIFDRLLEAGRSRDPDRVVALCTDDVVFEDTGVERPLHGREQLREMLAGLYGLVSEFHLDMLERYVALDGRKACARWKATGTLRNPAGQPVNFETAEFYEFRNGLVCHWTFVARDPNWLGRQWGA